VALPKSKPKQQENGRSRKQQRGRKPESEEDEDAVPDLPQTILFVSRCRTAAHLSLMLDELEIPNTPLHSHLSQRERLASLNDFRAARKPLLIATDVGSRGLDIPEVEVVINWDVPRDPADYVHRVGRTARAGKKGTSITFVTEGDVDLVSAVEEKTGATMTELPLPEEKVLEELNKVTTAKRVATMELHEDKFGEKQDIRKKKQRMLDGKSDDKTKRKKRKQEKMSS
jgi:ATP-dependent RNA helicase DDX49/DBP8